VGERLVIGTAPRKQLPVKPVAFLLGVGLLLAVVITRLFVFEMVQVRGGTMAPNAMEGDILLVASLGDPALGSVVLVEHGEREVLRRIVGLPGDTITTADGVLVRNGVPLGTEEVGVFGWLRDIEGEPDARPHRQALVAERFADGRLHHLLADHDGTARPWRLSLPEVEVPPGHVFVLCDNRRICSLDDQAGPVRVDRITGVARSVLWRGGSRDPSSGVRSLPGAFDGLASHLPDADPSDQGSGRGSTSVGGPIDGSIDSGMGTDGGSLDSTTDSPLK